MKSSWQIRLISRVKVSIAHDSGTRILKNFRGLFIRGFYPGTLKHAPKKDVSINESLKDQAAQNRDSDPGMVSLLQPVRHFVFIVLTPLT